MNICIYGASSNTLAPIYYDEAERFGRLLARGGHTLVFGGGQRGLMGACARGVSAEGGSMIAVAPRFFDEPGLLCGDCARLLFTESMSERKALMAAEADAFLLLPGGIGSYEEFFETLTLKQLGRHNKQMAMLNTNGCYDLLLAALRSAVDEGFIGASCLTRFAVCDTPEQALAHLLQSPLSSQRDVFSYMK